MALQSLAWDTEVPAELIDLEVNSGVVTLKGDVSYQLQSDAVYDDVANLFGVIGINNEINGVDAETDEQSKRTSSRAPEGARRAR